MYYTIKEREDAQVSFCLVSFAKAFFYKIAMASAMMGGIVKMLKSVVALTSPAETSASRPYFAANIETIAATGAEAAVTSASIIILSRSCRNG